MSKIEWTGKTWNPIGGCTAISPGCANCYAAIMTRRLEAMGQADYAGLTNAKHFNGVLRLLPHKLDIPLRRKKPTTWFVNSMSDLFHADVPLEFQTDVFEVMAKAHWHTFQVLTKRDDQLFRLPEIAAGVAYRLGKQVEPGFWPLTNVWLGVSCEDQKRKHRINTLRPWQAAVRFLSLEPLLEDLGTLDLRGIDWVIVGGESGSGARPCNIEWIRSIVRQCRAAGVPCFVKQLGAAPYSEVNMSVEQFMYPNGGKPTGLTIEGGMYQRTDFKLNDRKGGNMAEWPSDLRVREMPNAKTNPA